MAERLLRSIPVRAVLAALCLCCHLYAIRSLGEARFQVTWMRPVTADAPQYRDAVHDMVVPNWSRLLVSRWDAQHYIALALRGYEPCKPRAELAPGEYPDDNPNCQLNFFPTYGFVGRWVANVTGWAIDYALLTVSLVSSFVVLMIWTSKPVVDALGVPTTYLSLLLLNVFTTGFVLVTLQTEPLFLALVMGSFYAVARRWWVAGAILAGAASAIRVTGVAAGGAFGLALLWVTLEERPRWTTWCLRAGYAAMAFWGIALLMGYYHERFGDALIYLHAHGRHYHHEASIALVLFPDTRRLMQSIWAEPHDGVWLAAALLWFSLGHRRGLGGFDPPTQAFWYGIFFFVVGISTVGSSEYAFGGLSRYLLCVPPLFFAMAGVMRRRPVTLALWLYVSVAHYWSGNMCFYVGQQEPDRFGRCGFARATIE